MSHNTRKCTLTHVLPQKIQISLDIPAVWSESSMGAYWKVKDAKFLYVDNEEWSDCEVDWLQSPVTKYYSHDPVW